MKVQPVIKETGGARSTLTAGNAARNRRIGRDLLIALATCVIIAVFAINYAAPLITKDLTNWIKAKGFIGAPGEFQTALLAAPANLIVPRAPLPKLTIDIKFKHFEKLRKKRAEALKRQRLVSAKDDFVPAKIRMEGREIKVSIRLKGDLTDHLQGAKWSLRIKVKGSDHVFGMRRFSIQNPRVRGFQSESLFLESLRMAGLIAPRYRFIDVTLNGNDIGIMAMEEHFSNELLATHGRREGVIVRFSEFDLWDSWARNIGPSELRFDDFKYATVESFRSSKIEKSPRLAKNFATSVRLLRAFAQGKLSAADVFEPDLLGRFIALADLWEAQHALFWNNLRFYLNPISLKHEIIGYDAALHIRPRRLVSISRKSPIFARMLEDDRVFAAYETYLRKFGREIIEGNLIATLKKFEEKRIKELAQEFYLSAPYPFDELRTRANYLLGLTKDALRMPPIKPEGYPTLVRAYLIEDKGKRYLELVNATSYDIEIRSIYWSSGDDSKQIAFEPEHDLQFPIKFAPSENAASSTQIAYRPPANEKPLTLHVKAAFKSLDHVRVSTAIRYHAPQDKPPLQIATVDAQNKKHRFLQIDKTLMHVQPGAWTVKGSIHVPRGFTLSVPKGTTLRFDEGEGIIAFGPVHLSGTPQQPVVLEGRKSTGKNTAWNGVAVIEAKEPSIWSHALIRDTQAVSRTDWELTGGVTFYRSDVRMQSCRFDGSAAEDALNIVNSEFTLTDVTIENTSSDGLDADFSTGEIHNGLFHNIGAAGGGDAVDISGSQVTVNGTVFRNVSDKALSVGERSTMTANNIVIANAATGAASKDGSRLTVEGADISGASVAGFMAYIKKQEYGPATIIARGTLLRGNNRNAWSQTNSSITIDEKPVAVQNIDVERLYETAMKPARKR
jgi:hypothetical protein